MKEKLIEIIKHLDLDLQEIVIEVLEKEREYIALLRPRGIKEDIREIIDKHANYPQRNGDG